MLAAYHGHADVVRVLVQHGADPNRINDRGQSPLAGAVFKKENDVIEVCETHPTYQNVLLIIIQALLEGGADPDHGSPTAMECITMFKQDEYKEKFENAPGRGKASTA